MTSTIKVDKIQDQDGNNIINENSNTITIGASGDTIVIPSGATITNNGSQTGFGRTGTVDWQTSIKTSTTFSASNGEGYFVDTSSNAITANLPAGSVGAIVAFKDYAQNFDTNALTISANGSDKIEGQDFDLVLRTEGAAVTLVFGDSTKGWQAVNSNEVTNAESFITATGGTITTVCTNFKVHTFTGPGSFVVTAGNGPISVADYMVIAGGGGAGPDHGGGGGAGGYRESHNSCTSGPYTASPLATPTSLSISPGTIPVTVGAGGTGGSATADCAARGSSSVFSSITSTGGGGMKFAPGTPLSQVAMTGGSGSGASGQNNNPGTGAAGNTPPVSPPQGNSGGNSQATPSHGAGGGGGAGGVGQNGGSPQRQAGSGGAGTLTHINGSPVTRASGGSGGTSSPGSPQPATTGGGGAGGAGPTQGGNGTANTGGGGGGGTGNTPPFGGGNGGSGLVIIRYKFQ